MLGSSFSGAGSELNQPRQGLCHPRLLQGKAVQVIYCWTWNVEKLGREMEKCPGAAGGCCLARSLQQQILAALGWERNCFRICLHEKPK